jgi:hypothetical protein
LFHGVTEVRDASGWLRDALAIAIIMRKFAAKTGEIPGSKIIRKIAAKSSRVSSDLLCPLQSVVQVKFTVTLLDSLTEIDFLIGNRAAPDPRGGIQQTLQASDY